ncbi:HlyD family efflux transporter periplasmic adaptor subunit [Candidatus Gracilibacteria bacterium]|nr:MAG: HlyD family efflux transporter periplasmic adaptor subunit [Candidatus Gracilibacteria bacterium]
MRKYFILSIILSLFLLYSCTGSQENTGSGAVEKGNFLIETKTAGNLNNEYALEKSSKIEAASEIVLTSEATGRVENIAVKEGDNVSKGQNLVYLFDNSMNLNTAYKQAILNLDQAKIQYSNQKLALDKNIEDSELALTKLKLNYENTKKNIEQDVIQAKDNLKNSDVNASGSKTSLDVQKIDNSIAKMEFELETLKKSNKDKIDSFISNVNREKDNLNNLLVSVINFGEELYATKYPVNKPAYYLYLGAENNTKKTRAEQTLQKLINYKKDTFDGIKLVEKDSEILDFITKIEEGYAMMKSFLDDTLEVITSSVSEQNYLPETMLTGYHNQVNGYIQSYTSASAGLVAMRSNVVAFLNTYKDNEASTEKQIDLVRKDKEIALKSYGTSELSSKVAYEKIMISSQDTISNLELQLKSAETTLINAKKTRDITLQNLENAIKAAELNVEKSSIEVSKLVVKSPISAQVASIDVTVGQTYNMGSQMLKLISTSKRELDVYVTSEDLEKIHVGDKVYIKYRGENFEGDVFSKSNVANETLNYKVKVSLNKDIHLVGGVADVSFKLKSKFPLININSVTVLHSQGNKKIGEINIFKGGKLDKLEVELGDVYGKFIEIKTPLEKDTEIILNDVSNFDSEKFELKKSSQVETNTGKTQESSTGKTQESNTGKIEETNTGKTTEKQSSTGKIEEKKETNTGKTQENKQEKAKGTGK